MLIGSKRVKKSAFIFLFLSNYYNLSDYGSTETNLHWRQKPNLHWQLPDINLSFTKGGKTLFDFASVQLRSEVNDSE